METRPHTRESILALLHEDSPRGNRALERALIVLHDRQTRDEQEQETTRHYNLRGFMPFDAKKMSSFATQIKRSRNPKGEQLSQKQRGWLRTKPNKASRYPSRIGKYAAQLAEVANGA